MMTRWIIKRQLLALALGGGLAVSSFGVQPDSRPNVIWIVAEDICPDLACYGHPLVKTPHLDQLAAEGIRFTRAYATCSVCSPTRSAFFTGMFQTSIGAHHHRSHMDDGYQLPDGIRLLSNYFREAGYFTLLMGPKQKTDFNFAVDHPVFDATDGEMGSAMGAYHHGAVDQSVFDGPSWAQYDGSRPFFAQINYSETHRTFTHDPSHPIAPDTVVVPPYYPDEPLVRADWALYLETIQVLDQKIGKLVADLKARGLYENSIIVFFGDHGRPMLRDKQWLYDGGIHVPLIIRGPGIGPRGSVCDELVSLIDLAPTSLQLAGSQVPGHMQGRVICGDAKGAEPDYVFAARDRCDETDDRIRAVQGRRFKYIRNFHPERPYTQFNAYKEIQYPVLTLMQVRQKQNRLTAVQRLFFAPARPAEELYDLATDPFEIVNLADELAYEATLLTMREALDEWIVKTGDQGALPEDPAVMAYWDHFFKEYYQSEMSKRGLQNAIDEAYLEWWNSQVNH